MCFPLMMMLKLFDYRNVRKDLCVKEEEEEEEIVFIF